MATNTSISLDTHFTDFIDAQIQSGRFKSTSEVIRAGLRLLEDIETSNELVRRALAEGEKSGEPEEFDFDAFIQSKKQ